MPGFTQVSQPNPDLEPEALWAYEVGYRVRPHDRVSMDLAAFFNDYDDLVTSESTLQPVPPTRLVQNANNGSGESAGVELAAAWQPFDWWRLQATYSYLWMELEVEPGSTDTSLVLTAQDSPTHQASLRSSWDVIEDVRFDAWLRYVDELERRRIPSYVTLDLRLAWSPNDHWEFAVVGQNLLEDSHQEFVFLPTQWAVPRSVYGKVSVKF
jgi:iron complex outermembrane receptor protein